MADRVASADASLYIDAPKLTTPATVTIADPLGVTLVTAAAATDLTDSRLGYTLLAANTAKQGTYRAVWTGANAVTAAQDFTVGAADAPGLTYWDLRLMVAAREGLAIEGAITDYEAGVVIDADMVGGAKNYLNRWLVVHPAAGTALAMQARRIKDWNGSGLTLSRPFGTAPVAGDRYAIFLVDPREIDKALRVAFRELADRARVPVIMPGVVLLDGGTVGAQQYVAITLPADFTHIHSVWNRNSALLRQETWELTPGRKLYFRRDGDTLIAGSVITIQGIRRLRFPQFGDSTIEVEPSALVARAAMEVLATRAGGAGTDTKEHLRRSAMAQQEYADTLRFSSGRMPPGSKPVIP